MKVGTLRAELSKYPAETEIVIAASGSEWKELRRVDDPIKHPQDDIQAAVCLVAGAKMLPPWGS